MWNSRNRISNGDSLYLLAMIVTILSVPAMAQSTVKQPGIQDNSFLVEEAYNQERGVVQHISTFSRMWNSKDSVYTFTQEWPVPRDWRHQVSYSLIVAHAGAFSGSGVGWGDVILNYRYQLLGNGETRTAFSPRLSLLLPSGDERQGRGFGAKGIQLNLPFSAVLHPRLLTHWNAGATFVAQAHNAVRDRADTVGYNLGQSFIWMTHPRDKGLPWEKWSPQMVKELIADNKPVYIDFTARWCSTCQFNHRVYDAPEIRAEIKKRGIVMLKADWSASFWYFAT